jgi:hypothetical protein
MIKAPPMMLAQKYIALDLTIFDKWILDLGNKISIYKIIIIILFLVEYLMHILYSTSLKLHKSLANFKKFFYFFG